MRVSTPRRFSLFAFFSSWCLVLATSSVLHGQTVNASPIVLDGHLQRHVITAQSVSQVLTFEKLIPGETYALIVPDDPTIIACMPKVSADAAKTNVLSYDAAMHQLRFVADAATMSFRLDYPCTWDADNPPRHYVSLACQTCVKKDLNEYLKAMAVIEINGGGSAEELVKEVLIGGNCFDITNVTFSGNGGQIGTFSNGATNIGFSSGMAMATGDVSVGIGPNNSDNASAGYGASTPDSDLSQLSGSNNLFDLANVEFDFTPTQTPLTFEYVFASEEYCEYVGSQFNDAFGFFISGPGISGPFGGAANIASLGPGNYVSINNVNHLTNSGFYVNNQPPSSGNLCGQSPSFGQATNEVQFDGFTRKLVAVANVQPCQTYRIKLKICDVGDGIFDSGVFLKAGSFDAGGNASVEWLVNDQPDVDEVYEGCGTVKLLFDRVGGNLGIPLTVQYTITGTATSGADFGPIPLSVIIPAGQDKLTINVPIVADLLAEGAETVILKLANACSCVEPTITLTILDLVPLTAVADTAVICGTGTGTLTVTPDGGVGPYSFFWSNGSTQQTISPYVATSTNYKVTVTDDCGKTFVSNARIIVTPPPTAKLMGPAPQICPGESAFLPVTLTGTAPFQLVYSINGDAQPPITDILTSPYMLEINEPGLYIINSVVDANGCEGAGTGSLLVVESTLSTIGVVTNPTCAGQSNGAINTTVTGGQGPFIYAWQGPQVIPPFIQDPTNLQAGTYMLTVTDFSGCKSEKTFSVVDPPAVVPTVANVQGVNCYNPSGGSIDLSVTGGTPNYTYIWTGGSTSQDPAGLATGAYTVTVTDSKGCSKTTTATVPSDFTPPTASAAAPDQITCAVTSVSLDGSGSSTGPNFSYNWTASGGGNILDGATTLNPIVNQAGTYTIVVTNTTNGCTASKSVQATADNTLPTAAAGPNQTLTCILDNVTLDGTGSSTGPDFVYQWTASPGGTILGGGTTLNPVVSTNGTYTLLVTNNSNGCTKTDDALVNSNVTPPNAAIATPPLLTCVSTTVTLNGGGSTPASGLSYSWSTTNGTIQSGQATANAVISEPGQYTLVVTNNANGCTDSETVTVNQDNSVPTANATVTEGLDCNTTQLTISGAGSSTGPNFTFSWSSTPGGNFLSGQSTLNPVINTPATYIILVTNITNNCTATASVTISQDIQPPAAVAGPPATLTCITTTLVLGDPNAPIAPNLTYAWTTIGGNIFSGGGTPTPTVNQPGTYNLLVTNSANGCTNNASVVIAQNTTLPTAVVAQAPELNCTTPAVQLNGAGSSTGPSFSYDWTSSTGGGVVGGGTLTPTVTAAGTYTLIVTNNTNGCTKTASTTVTSNANLPTALATPSGILTCVVEEINLSSNGSSSGPNFSYQWGTVNGQITGGQGTATLTVSTAGQYTLLVTNITNNCTATFSVDVEADEVPPTADAGTSETLICTQPTFTLDGSGSSTGGNFTYSWTAVAGGNFTTPVNIQNPTVDEPGTYQILVTNTQNGCTATDEVQILQDANDPVVQIAAPAVLNCTTTQTTLNGNGSSTGANISYVWTGPGIVSGGGTLTPLIEEPGDYLLVITNSSNGCKSEQMVAVNEDIAPPPADAGPDFVLNCYDPQHQLGGPGNPTDPIYTFVWTGPGILSGGSSASPVIDEGGDYILVVTNTSNGCTTQDAVAIATDFAEPSANAGPTFQLTCVQNNYTMQAVASQGSNFTYSWTTNTGNFTTPVNILNPTVDGAGDYFLLVTNTTNGCTATSNVQITQAADVPVAIANDAPLLTCAVTTLNLSGAGSSTGTEFIYSWTASNGGNIVNGAATLNPIINEPGIYILAVTNTTNNCTASSSVIVSEDVALPTIDAGQPPTLTCTILTVDLEGEVNSNGSFSYLWTASNGGNIVTGNNTLSPSVNATGTYNLVVTNNSNGCSSTDNVQVLADQNAPVAEIVQPDILTCTTEQITLDATNSSVGDNFKYAWTTIGGNILDLSDELEPVVNEPGGYTLVVTNIDNGCTETFSIEVAQDIENPTANAGGDGLLTCAVTSLQLNGSGSSQNGNYFYQWTTPNGQILVGANSLNPTVVAGGAYTLVVVDNDNGCTSSDNVQVTVNTQPPAAVIASPSIITCVQPQVTLNGGGSTGGNVSYSWTTLNGNIVSGQSNNQAVVNASGSYTLTVLNNTNGCSSTATATVSDNIVLPVANAGNPFTLTCSVEQVTLQGSGSNGSIYTYTWSTQGGQIVSGNNTLNPVVNQQGIYTLTVANSTTGCTETDEVEVFLETNVPTGFVVDLEEPSCKDNDGVITFGTITGGVGPYLYSINGGSTFLDKLDFTKITPGDYDLWIQDANGCEFHQTLSVPKAPDPGVNLAPEFNIILGDSLVLEAVLPPGYPLALIDTIIWTPLEGLSFESNNIFDLLSPTAKPFKPTEYKVTIISGDGCEASDRVLIRVDNDPKIYIPNVFSPWQEDGDNDIVYIFANEGQVVKIKSFQIFDRWGEMVFQDVNFQPNDPSHGWDGQLRGKLQTPAVFVYFAEIELIDGRTLLYKGDITLLR